MASKQISLLDAIDEKSHIPKKPLYYIDLGIHFKINIRANQDVLQYIFWTHNGAVYRPIVTCYGNRNFDNLKEFYARTRFQRNARLDAIAYDKEIEKERKGITTQLKIE